MYSSVGRIVPLGGATARTRGAPLRNGAHRCAPQGTHDQKDFVFLIIERNPKRIETNCGVVGWGNKHKHKHI